MISYFTPKIVSIDILWNVYIECVVCIDCYKINMSILVLTKDLVIVTPLLLLKLPQA